MGMGHMEEVIGKEGIIMRNMGVGVMRSVGVDLIRVFGSRVYLEMFGLLPLSRAVQYIHTTRYSYRCIQCGGYARCFNVFHIRVAQI